MRELSWHCPFPAVPWSRAGRNGKRTFTPPKMAQFQRSVADYAWEAIRKRYWSSFEPWTGPIELGLYVVVPMPKSWSNKKRVAMNGRPHCQKPDFTNHIKCVEDALNGVVYVDDCQVYRFSDGTGKYWGEKPGFRVTVREVAS